MPVSPELKQRADKILSMYDPETRDAIYRHLWHGHVKDDVMARARDLGIGIDDGMADFAAEIYVYEGGYDCNENYWSNIDNAIRLARERTG